MRPSMAFLVPLVQNDSIDNSDVGDVMHAGKLASPHPHRRANWYHDDDEVVTSCVRFTTDENGSWLACDEWDSEDLDGFILAGSIGFGAT